MSEEQRNANRAVHEALEGWVQALPYEGGDGDIGILGDWLAVVSMVRVDEEGRPRTQYYLVFRDTTMLPHVALGLLHQGIEETNASVTEDP